MFLNTSVLKNTKGKLGVLAHALLHLRDMERRRRLKALIRIALLTWTTVLCLPAQAREMVLRTPDQLIRGELSFPLADGWSKPVLTRSKDGFALQLWFSEAPLDAISAVARVFSPETRKALTQIEVYQVPGQTVVQIHLRNRAKGLFIKPSNAPRGWTFIANLHEPPEI